jgi:small subunit ribosomal protein S1
MKSKSILERVENALGEAILSREKARREESWVRLEEGKANEKVEGRSSTRSRAASPSIWTAPWPSCRAARSTSARCATSGPLMNIPQPFQILKMDKRRGNIVVSRRAFSKRPAPNSAELVQNLEEGQVLEGVVKNITDYGAFVDLGGIDGLLHVTDMAWRRVNHPSEGPVDRPDRQGPDHPHQPGNPAHQPWHEAAGSDPWEGIGSQVPVGKRSSPAA